MRYNTMTLPSGLRIIHLPSSSPVVYCGYQIAAGSRDEQSGEEGLAHFCEHMTFKGTAQRNALQIINALERLGGELNAYTNKESTVFYAAVQKEHLRVAVDLLTDMVFNSTYPQAEMNREVEVICDEIESYNDSPAELIYDEFENILFDGHPLGHNILGQADRLRAYTSDDLLHFARRHYTPMKSVFFASGDIDFQRLVRLISAALPSTLATRTTSLGAPTYTEGPTLPENSTFPENPSQLGASSHPENAAYLEINKSTHQAHVVIGTRAYAANDPRRVVLYLLNNLLGGPSMNARLNLSLRERNGLVYTVESSMVVYADTGVWTIYFGCDAHDIARCRRLVRRELDKLMERPLTKTALATAKQQLKGQLAIASDNREQFALDFGKVFLFDAREHRLEGLFDKIDTVSADDITKVARDLFAADHLTTLVFR